MREPLLNLAVDLPPLKETQRRYFLDQFSDAVPFGSGAAAILRLNKTFGDDAEAKYQAYIERRNEFQRRMKRSKNEVTR